MDANTDNNNSDGTVNPTGTGTKKVKRFSQTELVELHKAYLKNILQYPAILGVLSEQLGLSTLSLREYQVGFIPVTPYDTGPAWAFPERNEHGDIIGITVRMMDGKKLEIAGSKRGLTYRPRYETSDYEKKKWQRVSIKHPCVLCGKADGCMYPEGEAENPAAVCCVHISTGSERPLGVGHLHILDSARNARRVKGGILGHSDRPIIITEGATDAIAAADMGFISIGRANAAVNKEKEADLISLVRGRSVVIVGDRDPKHGIGQKAMNELFIILREECSSVVKVLPPEGIKDLRQWLATGLKQDGLLEYIKVKGDSKLSEGVFEDNQATTVGAEILKSRWTDSKGRLTLAKYKGNYVEYIDGRYQDIVDENESLRCEVLHFLANKKYVHPDDGKIKPLNQTTPLIRNTISAINKSILIKEDAPCWRDAKDGNPDPKKLVLFKNGFIDLNEYLSGDIILHDPTPEFFSSNGLDYNFDPDAESEIWNQFLKDVFEGDEESITLLSQWFGHCLVPDMRRARQMFLFGKPRTGKSTMLKAMMGMLGKNNYAAASYKDLNESFGLEDLPGKLAVITGDDNSLGSRETDKVLALIKRVTGGDPVKINKKFQHKYTTQLSCRFTLAMNELPAFTDETGALIERTLILFFNKSFAKSPNPDLPGILQAEAASGKLINFALRGLKLLEQQDKFIEPRRSREILREFRGHVSPIIEFIEDCIDTSDNGSVLPTNFLYDVWCWWCKPENRFPGYKNTFIRNLLSYLPDVTQCRPQKEGERVRSLGGINLTEKTRNDFTTGSRT